MLFSLFISYLFRIKHFGPNSLCCATNSSSSPGVCRVSLDRQKKVAATSMMSPDRQKSGPAGQETFQALLIERVQGLRFISR